MFFFAETCLGISWNVPGDARPAGAASNSSEETTLPLVTWSWFNIGETNSKGCNFFFWGGGPGNLIWEIFCLFSSKILGFEIFLDLTIFELKIWDFWNLNFKEPKKMVLFGIDYAFTFGSLGVVWDQLEKFWPRPGAQMMWHQWYQARSNRVLLHYPASWGGCSDKMTCNNL